MSKDGEASCTGDYSEIFGTVPFPLKQHASPHGRVTAVSMMKDEGPFVLEWVAHHLAVGFTDIVVFTNDCSDGTDDMLIRLEELGLVHHRRNDIPEGRRPQPSALKYAQEEPVVTGSDWVLVFDADEFLCIKHGDGSLDGMISEAKALGANGIVVTWRIFGSGGVHDWSRAPVTEQYTYAAPPMWNKGWGVKTLFAFDPEYWVLGIHRPRIKKKHLETDFPDTVRWLNGSGRPMEDYFKFRGWRSIVRTVGYDWTQMNHYAVKSIDSYAIRKFRGNVNLKKDKYNSDYWSLQDRNEVFDDSALRHAERRKEIFDLLLTDPVLNNLHSTAIENVEARLESFKSTQAYADMVADLKEASKVPITEVVAKPPQARDPEKIAALMSDVEKKRNEKTKADRRNKAHPEWGRNGDPYVQGHIDLSGSPAIAVIENRGIKVPADPRVFAPLALQTIQDGKFERNLGRHLARLVGDAGRYLEIGAGAGFLPLLVARECAKSQVVAQEEKDVLRAFCKITWGLNAPLPEDRLKLSDTPLFNAEDPRQRSSGLNAMLSACRPDVLHVNDPRVSAEMLAGAVEVGEARPSHILLGIRALLDQMEAGKARELLTPLGYAQPEESPFAGVVHLQR
ncbi:MAG: glycosyltransferase family 2 protein [Pseudomonadota bacterium]